MRKLQHRTPRRRGVETLELIVALPVLVIAVLAVVQFGVLMVVHQAATAATASAAREAGKQADIGVVLDAVNRTLATHAITVTAVDGSGAKVMLEDGQGGASSFGDSLLACVPRGEAPGANEVRVTLCLDLKAAKAPNPLALFGFDFTGRRLETSATVRKE